MWIFTGQNRLFESFSDKKTKKYILREEDEDGDDKNRVENNFGLEWDLLSDDYLLVASEISGLRLVDVEKECTVCKYYLPSRAIHVRTLSWIPDGRGLFVTGGRWCQCQLDLFQRSRPRLTRSFVQKIAIVG